MATVESLVEVQGLKKFFTDRGRVLKAVDEVSFRIAKGEVLGLVGESGCGKTTIGRLLLNLLPPTGGAVHFNGVDIFRLSKQDMRQMRHKMQIVFQDPYSSLNPRMTIGGILTFPMKVQGLYKGNEWQRALYLLGRVGLDDTAINRYPHEFSGGQLQRVGIARALSVDPEFIVADEPVSALDISIQSQVLNLFKELQEEFNLTTLFISHDLSVVEFISDRIAVVYMGKIAEIGPAKKLFKAAQHPYTKSLISAILQPDPVAEQKKPPFSLVGEISSPIDPPPGCRFYSRCPERMNVCKEINPRMVEVAPNHELACWLFDPERPA
ncbi:MAG: ABC transporter ATP-binding protein [SAR324 cluster bacterium]|nr:ABC transporter ATP-binding protein [SAR324 cluster bacterium]